MSRSESFHLVDIAVHLRRSSGSSLRYLHRRHTPARRWRYHISIFFLSMSLYEPILAFHASKDQINLRNPPWQPMARTTTYSGLKSTISRTIHLALVGFTPRAFTVTSPFRPFHRRSIDTTFHCCYSTLVKQAFVLLQSFVPFGMHLEDGYIEWSLLSGK